MQPQIFDIVINCTHKFSEVDLFDLSHFLFFNEEAAVLELNLALSTQHIEKCQFSKAYGEYLENLLKFELPRSKTLSCSNLLPRNKKSEPTDLNS